MITHENGASAYYNNNLIIIIHERIRLTPKKNIKSNRLNIKEMHKMAFLEGGLRATT
jgi:hypothetical protein